MRTKAKWDEYEAQHVLAMYRANEPLEIIARKVKRPVNQVKNLLQTRAWTGIGRNQSVVIAKKKEYGIYKPPSRELAARKLKIVNDKRKAEAQAARKATGQSYLRAMEARQTCEDAEDDKRIRTFLATKRMDGATVDEICKEWPIYTKEQICKVLLYLAKVGMVCSGIDCTVISGRWYARNCREEEPYEYGRTPEPTIRVFKSTTRHVSMRNEF